MKNKFIFSLILMILLGCNETTKTEKSNSEFNLGDYTIYPEYEVSDIRRYGVFPDSVIAHHPKLKIDKLRALLNVASQGYELVFPSGLYNRSFIIDSTENIKLKFNNSVFTGSVKIRNSQNIELNGHLISKLEFYTRNVNKISVEHINVGTENSDNILGFQIHGKSKNVYIDKVIVTDLTTNPSNTNNKAALIIHGHNAEPRNINIENAQILASGRNGVYVSGEDISIGDLSINNYAYSTIGNMNSIEGLLMEESNNMSGLWIRNCWNCNFNEVKINTPQNSNANYIVNLGFGDETVPSTIKRLTMEGKKLRIYKNPRTNVNIEMIEK